MAYFHLLGVTQTTFPYGYKLENESSPTLEDSTSKKKKCFKYTYLKK